MASYLIAKIVEASIEGEDEDSYISIAFDNGDVNVSEYVILQKALTYSEDDKELGMDQIYVEINGQQGASYGGVLRIVLKSKELDVYFDSKTARKLGAETELIINFPENHENLGTMKALLEQMLNEEPVIYECEI